MLFIYGYSGLFIHVCIDKKINTHEIALAYAYVLIDFVLCSWVFVLVWLNPVLQWYQSFHYHSQIMVTRAQFGV